ncbi:hypothetical protein ACI2L1_31570 [Streptomyces sp. NPDC019531]|uniref:hypothetical protein n=1 Tax=Streptomyces sp. NPDC019531 TaxID=3365062 RepID=UPI00384AEF0B
MFLLVPLLILVLVVTACGFLGYGGGRTADWLARRAQLPTALRGFAALAGAMAALVYTWGLLYVVGAILEAEDGGTSSSPIMPCRTDARAVHVVDYSVSFLPLSFVCETNDGGSYPADEVPGYVTPVAVGLALAAAGCAVSSAYVTELRARAAVRKGEAEG